MVTELDKIAAVLSNVGDYILNKPLSFTGLQFQLGSLVKVFHFFYRVLECVNRLIERDEGASKGREVSDIPQIVCLLNTFKHLLALLVHR